MRTLLPTLVFGLTLLSSNMALANSANLTTCPTLTNYVASHFAASIPYGYNAHTKKLNIYTIVEYLSDDNQAFDFMLYPITILPGENLINRVNAIITQLQPDNAVPFNYKVNDEDGSVAVCSYSIPGNTSLSALIIADDSDLYDDYDFSSKQAKRSRARQLFMKQVG